VAFCQARAEVLFSEPVEFGLGQFRFAGIICIFELGYGVHRAMTQAAVHTVYFIIHDGYVARTTAYDY